jgi:hypothetical protein
LRLLTRSPRSSQDRETRSASRRRPPRSIGWSATVYSIDFEESSRVHRGVYAPPFRSVISSVATT